MAPFTISTLPSLNICHFRKPGNRILPIRCSTAASPSSVSIRSKAADFDLKTYWTSLMVQINQKLDEAIPVKFPQQIYEAMRYSSLAKGAKRAPPVMCISACELFGGSRLAAFPTACALEMVHAASLIHDDLPCMDDSSSRRGHPSNHTIYGVDMAILAGQFLDLEGGPNAVGFIQDKKFGEMGECSAVCGGLLAGAKDDEIERLRRYGRAVGVLYAVVDDILEERLKPEGDKDRKNRGKSYVGVYGVEKAAEIAEELRAKAMEELDGFEKYGDQVLPLYSFVNYAIDRSFNVDDASG
ncbi:unnamed protein product [Vicia faba]|uniref:Uncharacterized protein n=1 Tax=Vicia faba TaxID=3906 RepID=A0AAV1B5D1_VICFA|nr:unnamed protein product [Vicia faba]